MRSAMLGPRTLARSTVRHGAPTTANRRCQPICWPAPRLPCRQSCRLIPPNVDRGPPGVKFGGACLAGPCHRTVQRMRVRPHAEQHVNDLPSGRGWEHTTHCPCRRRSRRKSGSDLQSPPGMPRRSTARLRSFSRRHHSEHVLDRGPPVTGLAHIAQRRRPAVPRPCSARRRSRSRLQSSEHTRARPRASNSSRQIAHSAIARREPMGPGPRYRGQYPGYTRVY